jgi:hypothetical protein
LPGDAISKGCCRQTPDNSDRAEVESATNAGRSSGLLRRSCVAKGF